MYILKQKIVIEKKSISA